MHDLLERRLTELAHAQAGAFGCTAVVDYTRRYPPLVTHAGPTAVSGAAVSVLVGAAKVDAESVAYTGSEDFSFMLEARPGGCDD